MEKTCSWLDHNYRETRASFPLCPFQKPHLLASFGQCWILQFFNFVIIAATLGRFLVFGFFTNLAIIKNKLIKMFSLLRVIWTIWEVSQMIRRLLTSRDKLLDRSRKRLFLKEIISQRRENLSVPCYLSNYYCSRKLISFFIDQHFICLTPRCHYDRTAIFPFFSIWKFGRVVHAFWTPSRQPLDQFGWNLVKFLSDSLSTKLCLRILILLFISKL